MIEPKSFKLLIIGTPQSGKTTVIKFLNELCEEMGLVDCTMMEIESTEQLQKKIKVLRVRPASPKGDDPYVGHWSYQTPADYFVNNCGDFRQLKFQLRDLLLNEILK